VPDGFRHVDRERTIVFGEGALDDARELLGDGYTLLTTPRAAASAPDVVARAAAVVHVPAGLVEEVAAGLRAEVRGARLVSLGGGRVVDVAKALAAADGPREVAAIPTSLSAAEMTGMHRHARGVDAATPHVRPRLIVDDPALSASQPVDQLAASSANALAHAVAAATGGRTTPIARAVAGEAIRTLDGGWSAGEPDRAALALGALLAGWAVDHSGLGPHHAMAQTAVRTGDLAHAHANAALLPFTVAAMRRRDAATFARLDADLGRPVERLAEELRARAGADGLGALDRDPERFDRAVAAAVERAELRRAAPPIEREEAAAIYRAAQSSVETSITKR
jgi:maleylacetate reductase